MIAPHGRVYTPPPLAQRLATLALDGWTSAKPPRICDPACGDGGLLRAVRARCRDAALFGVDLDPGALISSRGSLGPAAQLEEADALTYPWPDGPFDVVIANPPWVSYSGRQAAPITPARRALLLERFELFRSWPSLHAAFVQLAVRSLCINFPV
jgi:methylase of polypeptide subunit release factors